MCTSFENRLVLIEEALSKAIGVTNSTKATRCELETQLRESRLEPFATKKIQGKAIAALEVTDEEVNHLETLLLEKYAGWTKEMKQI